METILLATELERIYPELYQNVSKQLQTTMSSAAIVQNIINKTAQVLFDREVSITWSRIIALLCTCAAVATDCVRQGQAKLVKVVIETFKSIIETKLSTWIRVHGGWVSVCRY